MKIVLAILTTVPALAVVYGLLSLLFVPGALGESYWSYGRILYGVIPVVSGIAVLGSAFWLARSR